MSPVKIPFEQTQVCYMYKHGLSIHTHHVEVPSVFDYPQNPLTYDYHKFYLLKKKNVNAE